MRGIRGWLGLIGLVAAAVMASTASAVPSVPHWYGHDSLFGEGEPISVRTKGTLELGVRSGEVDVVCKVKDAETIENPVGGGAGTGQVTEFALTGCKASPAVCAKGEKLVTSTSGLPWAMSLQSGSPIRDHISGMVIRLECHNAKTGVSTVYDTLGGALNPSVGASVLDFEGSGGLGETRGEGATFFSGTDKLIGPAKRRQITAQAP